VAAKFSSPEFRTKFHREVPYFCRYQDFLITRSMDWSGRGKPYVKNQLDPFVCFDRSPTCDRRRQPQYRASIASRGKNDVIYDATRLQLKATIILRLKPCSQRRTEVKWSGVKRANCSSIFIRGFHSGTPVREQQPFCSSAANQLRDADARDLVQLRRVTGSTRRGSVQFSSVRR